MSTIEGIDPTILLGAQKNALRILAQLAPGDLATLKNAMHLGMPAVIGPQTLATFVATARERGLDLSDAGVSAFKAHHGLDDSGANHGAIGPSTAAAYVKAIAAPSTPPPTGHRQVTDRGLRAVENFEGLVLHAYRDQVGVPTIGWGHTAGVQIGQVITREQAEAFLRADLAVAEEAVDRLVTVPLNDHQFDALVSFTFNCGTGALASSTLLRLLNKGDYQGAADQFLVWVRGDRGPLPGLVARRAEERALFLEA